MKLRRVAFALTGVHLLLFACASGGPSRAIPGKTQRGTASWYGEPFHGRATASGVIYDMWEVSAAHKTLPLGTTVEVANLDNGRTLELEINDRGPFVRGRIIDLSREAARELGMETAGLARVKLTIIEGPTSSTNRNLWVQVGAYAERAHAEKLVSEIGANFPRARITSADGLHRVQIPTRGPRKKALALQRSLRRQGYESVLVVAPRAAA